jgi:hypothetical protein
VADRKQGRPSTSGAREGKAQIAAWLDEDVARRFDVEADRRWISKARLLELILVDILPELEAQEIGRYGSPT